MREKYTLLLVGVKESFLTKALEKKVTETGWDVIFCTTEINALNEKLKDVDIVAYYMDQKESVKADVFHFLDEKLDEAGKQVLLIGEEEDLGFAQKQFGKNIVAHTFLRPLDTESFLKELKKKGQLYDNAEPKKSILIVDDDTTYMGLIRGWLKEFYQVAMANSGMQALKWLGNNHADLILLDYEMPVTSGPQVLAMLRSEPDTKDIPVMFLTGKDDKESVVQVLSLKPEGYLLKSIEKEKLIRELGKFFS
ncbi:Response regulator receiver domain-containing protein [Lachnospiraceae bacterium XBB1006]|nr:Response regulator receiver domain-containing protein [Lachnospiraceae bacterium XBB1006]